jgi:hypothetical protein
MYCSFPFFACPATGGRFLFMHQKISSFTGLCSSMAVIPAINHGLPTSAE